jgi:hypothetical protein
MQALTEPGYPNVNVHTIRYDAAHAQRRRCDRPSQNRRQNVGELEILNDYRAGKTPQGLVLGPAVIWLC